MGCMIIDPVRRRGCPADRFRVEMLLTEVGEGVAHGFAGDFDQPFERLIHLQDQEDGPPATVR